MAAHLQPQHALTFAVAAGTAGIGFAGGGSDPIAYSATSLVVWGTVLVGVAVGWFPRAEPPQAAILAGACLTGLVALIGASLLWASDDGAAFEDLVRAFAYLGLFVLVLATSKRGDAAAWLRGLAIGLVVICVLALGARFEPSLFGGGDLDFNEQLRARPALGAAIGRLSYPIGYWNGLAAALAIGAVLLAWLGALAATPAGRALAVAALPLPLLGIYLTQSEGGTIAAALGLGVLLLAMTGRFLALSGLAIAGLGALVLVRLAASRDELLHDPGSALAGSQGTEMLVFSIAVVVVTGLTRAVLDRPIQSFRPSRRLVLGASGASALLVVVALIASGVNVNPVDRWQEFKRVPAQAEPTGGNFLSGSSSGRYQYWTTALEAFEEEPLSGIGASDFEYYWNQNGDEAVNVNEAHSLFIESAAELGVGGAVFSLGLFAVAAFTGVRRRGILGGPPRGAVPAALAVLTVGFTAAAAEWVWNLPGAFGAVIVAAALLTGPATLPALAPRVAPPMAFIRTRRRFAAGVATLLLAWAAICTAGLLLLAERALDDGQDAFFRADVPDALAQAAEAEQLEPWAAHPHVLRAQIYRTIGDISAAQAAIREAIERAPQQWRWWLIAVQLDVAANDLAGARVNFERAHELAPNLRKGSQRSFRDFVEQG